MYIKYIFFKKYINNKQVKLKYYLIANIITNNFTKPLFKKAFEIFWRQLGLK